MKRILISLFLIVSFSFSYEAIFLGEAVFSESNYTKISPLSGNIYQIDNNVYNFDKEYEKFAYNVTDGPDPVTSFYFVKYSILYFFKPVGYVDQWCHFDKRDSTYGHCGGIDSNEYKEFHSNDEYIRSGLKQVKFHVYVHTGFSKKCTFPSNYDINTDSCVTCKENEIFDYNISKCIPQCDKDKIWNDELQSCVPDCKNDEIWDPEVPGCRVKRCIEYTNLQDMFDCYCRSSSKIKSDKALRSKVYENPFSFTTVGVCTVECQSRKNLGLKPLVIGSEYQKLLPADIPSFKGDDKTGISYFDFIKMCEDFGDHSGDDNNSTQDGNSTNGNQGKNGNNGNNIPGENGESINLDDYVNVDVDIIPDTDTSNTPDTPKPDKPDNPNTPKPDKPDNPNTPVNPNPGGNDNKPDNPNPGGNDNKPDKPNGGDTVIIGGNGGNSGNGGNGGNGGNANLGDEKFGLVTGDGIGEYGDPDSYWNAFQKSLSKYDGLIDSIKNLKDYVDGKGIPKLNKYGAVNSCPFNDKFSGSNVNANVTYDLCKVLSPMRETFYTMFYLIFSAGFVVVCFKLLAVLFIGIKS